MIEKLKQVLNQIEELKKQIDTEQLTDFQKGLLRTELASACCIFKDLISDLSEE